MPIWSIKRIKKIFTDEIIIPTAGFIPFLAHPKMHQICGIVPYSPFGLIFPISILIFCVVWVIQN